MTIINDKLHLYTRPVAPARRPRLLECIRDITPSVASLYCSESRRGCKIWAADIPNNELGVWTASCAITAGKKHIHVLPMVSPVDSEWHIRCQGITAAAATRLLGAIGFHGWSHGHRVRQRIVNPRMGFCWSLGVHSISK